MSFDLGFFYWIKLKQTEGLNQEKVDLEQKLGAYNIDLPKTFRGTVVKTNTHSLHLQITA